MNDIPSFSPVSRSMTEGVGHETIAYPKLTEFHGHLDDLRLYGRVATGAEFIMLTGPTGAGKSQIVTSYVNQYPVLIGPDGDQRPVVKVNATKGGSFRSFAESILTEVGTRPKARASEETHIREIIRQFKEQKVELLIVDEADRLGGNNVAAEFFRGLLNRTATPIAFAGMASTERLNDNLQLQRRCRGVYRITGFDWFNPEEQRLYRSILKRLEAMMAFKPNGFSLSDTVVARRVSYAAYGLFGHTGLILRKTEEVVRREKDPSKYADGFTLEAMESAYSQLAIGKSDDPDVAIPRNPFGSSPLPETWAPADHTFGDQ
jgi:hypothetical protein